MSPLDFQVVNVLTFSPVHGFDREDAASHAARTFSRTPGRSLVISLFQNRITVQPSPVNMAAFLASRFFCFLEWCDAPSHSTATLSVGSARSTTAHFQEGLPVLTGYSVGQFKAAASVICSAVSCPFPPRAPGNVRSLIVAAIFSLEDGSALTLRIWSLVAAFWASVLFEALARTAARISVVFHLFSVEHFLEQNRVRLYEGRSYDVPHSSHVSRTFGFDRPFNGLPSRRNRSIAPQEPEQQTVSRPPGGWYRSNLFPQTGQTFVTVGIRIIPR
jgi:hypothetical protein